MELENVSERGPSCDRIMDSRVNSQVEKEKQQDKRDKQKQENKGQEPKVDKGGRRFGRLPDP